MSSYLHQTPQACGCSYSAAAASSEGGATGGMAMTFQSEYAGTPILFNALQPRNTGEFVAAVIVIFFLAVLFRCLILLRTFLEARCWGSSKADQDGAQEFKFWRDAGRAVLTAVTATVGYAVMLITMTFVAGYFFAVVGGLAVAEFFFARLVGAGGAGGHGCSG
ncbi:Ctr copper transporter family-domain-containing protein [Trichophaea hybrida]|nr:Ctr copper transporter family-domain-containing protein [Trichophaea hybrida]